MNKKSFSRIKTITNRTGMSRSAIYCLISQGKFPRQIHFGPRTSVWDNDEIDEWVETQIIKSRRAQGVDGSRHEAKSTSTGNGKTSGEGARND